MIEEKVMRLAIDAEPTLVRNYLYAEGIRWSLYTVKCYSLRRRISTFSTSLPVQESTLIPLAVREISGIAAM
jgi:hypothetical protein